MEIVKLYGRNEVCSCNQMSRTQISKKFQSYSDGSELKVHFASDRRFAHLIDWILSLFNDTLSTLKILYRRKRWDGGHEIRVIRYRRT